MYTDKHIWVYSIVSDCEGNDEPMEYTDKKKKMEIVSNPTQKKMMSTFGYISL